MGTTSKLVFGSQLSVVSPRSFRFLRRNTGQHQQRRGLWVVLLGPDGVGKSALVEAIGSGALAGFARCKSYHLRPSLAEKRNQPRANTNPHGQVARSAVITVLKLVYLVVMNWIAYIVAVRPKTQSGGLVLFDRYFPDCMVDYRRYRIPSSCRNLVKLACRFIPQPDLYLLLDAPASIVRKRKQEVSATELERQRNEYREMSGKLFYPVVLNAARSVDAVLDEALDCIVERHLALQQRVSATA